MIAQESRNESSVRANSLNWDYLQVEDGPSLIPVDLHGVREGGHGPGRLGRHPLLRHNEVLVGHVAEGGHVDRVVETVDFAAFEREKIK